MKQGGDVTRLPKWAQAEITRLKSDVAYLRSRLMEGPENSTVVAEPYSDSPRFLGEDPVIEFKGIGMQPSSIRIKRLQLGSNVLVISTDDNAIEVSPQSGNVIRVRSNKWWSL